MTRHRRQKLRRRDEVIDIGEQLLDVFVHGVEIRDHRNSRTPGQSGDLQRSIHIAAIQMYEARSIDGRGLDFLRFDRQAYVAIPKYRTLASCLIDDNETVLSGGAPYDLGVDEVQPLTLEACELQFASGIVTHLADITNL